MKFVYYSLTTLLCVVATVYGSDADVTVEVSADGSSVTPPPTPRSVRELVADRDIKGLNDVLSAASDINLIKGYSPLILSALGNFNEGVQMVLDKGANVDAPEDDGWTALMFCCSRGNIACVETLIKHNANPFLVPKNNNKWAYDMAFRGGHKEVS